MAEVAEPTAVAQLRGEPGREQYHLRLTGILPAPGAGRLLPAEGGGSAHQFLGGGPEMGCPGARLLRVHALLDSQSAEPQGFGPGRREDGRDGRPGPFGAVRSARMAAASG